MNTKDCPRGPLEPVVRRRRLTRKQRRMKQAVASMAAYMADYDKQDGYLDYSDKTLIDDVLYMLGTALDHEKHSWANGYDIFKAQLREHLGPPPNYNSTPS